MHNNQTIVKLLGRNKDAYTLPVSSWAREQRGKILCHTCFKLKRSVFPQPVDVPLTQLNKGTSYDGVFRGGVAVIHARLLDFLRSHLPEYALGRCYWKDGTLVPDYHTIYFRDTILIRTGEIPCDYDFYECEECGILGISSNVPYVLRGELPRADVYQDEICCIYLCESLACTFPWREFSDVEPYILPIRDGLLPDDPLPAMRKPISGEHQVIATPTIPPSLPFMPEPDRWAEIRSMKLEFPRRDNDSPKSCPIPMLKIMNYLRMETGNRDLRAKDLQFLRTARIEGYECWIWRFEYQVCADAYVTAWQQIDGPAYLSYRENTARLTPEQHIHSELHELFEDKSY